MLDPTISEQIQWPCELSADLIESLIDIAVFKSGVDSFEITKKFQNLPGVFYILSGSAGICFSTENMKSLSGGVIGSNKGVDINRNIKLDPITQKDFKAFQIAKKMKVKHFSFSFASCESDVKKMRNIIGNNSILISKIENKKGVKNLEEILKFSDSIIIDRGDLSRQVPIYKIPITQREIIKRARKKNKDTFVATNLLENMIEKINPTRAEVNDVISTLEMGAKGLVLAAETAIGKHPVETVGMINNLIKAFKKIQKN